MPAGNPAGYASMAPGEAVNAAMGPGGDMQALIALATQILGHPPRDEQELMMALQMLQEMQGGGSPGAAGRTMAPGPNDALLAGLGM